MFWQLKLLQCLNVSAWNCRKCKRREALTVDPRFWFFFFFFACEASFHSSCRRRYQRSQTNWWSANEEHKRGQEDLEESQRTDFTKVCDVIVKRFPRSTNHEISDSCETYVSALEKTKHSKPVYQAEKLKKKLEKSDTFGQTLPFCSLNSGGKFDCTLCTILTWACTDRAVTLAYELGSTDMVQDVSLYLRNMIAEAF